MKKLVSGLIRFRRERRAEYREQFAHLANLQSPDALFVACSDSRVVPNVFASTDPGDLFVLRNAGNLVPPTRPVGEVGPESAAAAVEFAVGALGVRDVVVCGHSDCGAMRALLRGTAPAGSALARWLANAEDSRAALAARPEFAPGLPEHDRLAQLNALVQLEHLQTHPHVQAAVAAGRLRLHAWFFDLAHADVHAWDAAQGRYVLLDEAAAEALLQTL